jgi:hypothetical protein
MQTLASRTGDQPAPRWQPVCAALAPLPTIDPPTRELWVALPDGGQARLPGALWPTPRSSIRPSSSGPPVPSPIAVDEVARADVNALYEAWGHPLGAYRRPFAEQHYLLLVDRQPIAAASSGSIQSRTVAGGLPRRRVVELARIARAPAHPHALRALLRLWREYLAPRWADRYWPVEAAIAYALPGRDGGLYRFDGWTRHGPCRPWAGGGTWSRPSPTNRIADGIKTLWIYRYNSAPTPPEHGEQLALAA